MSNLKQIIFMFILLFKKLWEMRFNPVITDFAIF